VIAQTQTFNQLRPDTRVVAAAFAAVVLFGVAWSLLHVGFYRRDQVIDTPIYQRYGNAITDGKVPYRDFAVEYPPGALFAFTIPGFAEPGPPNEVTTGFRYAFETLMWLCGAAVVLASALTLFSLRAERAHVWAALAFIAIAPLAIGSVILSRFDLWPTALVAAAIAALVTGRWRLGCGILGFAVATKFFPAVLVPPAVIYVWRRGGRREALVCAAVCVGVAAAVFAPFLALAPSGVWHSVTGQLTRPLQLESLGSAVLIAAHHVGGLHIRMETGSGSQNLAGSLPDAIAAIESALLAVSLLVVWVVFARGPATRGRLIRFSAASLAFFVAFGKVLSPQFMIWLVPVVPLVRGRRGVSASVLLGLALVLTQLWFPFRYWRLAEEFDPAASWLLLARDLILVALAFLLTLPDKRGDARELVADVPGPA